MNVCISSLKEIYIGICIIGVYRNVRVLIAYQCAGVDSRACLFL